jgi:alkaline phosphatase D
MITKIEVDIFTSDLENAGTDDAVYARIYYMPSSGPETSFEQQLNDSSNNFERGQHERFALTVPANMATLQPTSITKMIIRKGSGSDTWKWEAASLRVNELVLMSRRVSLSWDSANSKTFTVRAPGSLDGAEIEVTTGSYGLGSLPSTDDKVFADLIFNDSTQVSTHLKSMANDFEAGGSYIYTIPLPDVGSSPAFNKTAADIAEVRLRKDGSDGWFLKSARLFENNALRDVNNDDKPIPLMGNTNINQFLDNDPALLYITTWSSATIAGPVLGHISDTKARINYRVEREGFYKVDIFTGPSTFFTSIEAELKPCFIFEVSGLTANTHYTFKFYRKTGNSYIAIPAGDGEFRTFPSSTSGVAFSFGLGSCIRNQYAQTQEVWPRIGNIALNPANQPSLDDLRFFVHAGDTFYFYDDVSLEDMGDIPTAFVKSVAEAANLSSRLNQNFLTMAKKVPTVAVWDDHDFRIGNEDGDVLLTTKNYLRDTFQRYWANPTGTTGAAWPQYGLTSRLTYGNVDIYLMDGRFNRNKTTGILFSQSQIDAVLANIDSQQNLFPGGRITILVSGSTWNHQYTGDKEHYGDSIYNNEQTYFFARLNERIADGRIKGLAFLSGDIHTNQIYQVALPKVSATTKFAPEFVCSPLGDNTNLKPPADINIWDTELKANIGSEILSQNRLGFASISINTIDTPWTLTIKYINKDNGSVFWGPKTYQLTDNQFLY